VYHVTFDPPVRAAFRTFGLSRQGVVKLFVNVRFNLGHHAAQYQADRDPDNPSLFRYQHLLLDGGRLQTFDFRVDDRAEAGRLYVRTVQHTPGTQP
jgi:hypothetical protein